MQIPYKFAVPWASAAVPPYVTPVIPVSAGGTPNAATQQQGYPPVTGTNPQAGGIPPAMADWNGAMYYTTAWLQYLQAGAPIGYDAVFSAAIGGYPPGAIINNALASNAGLFWLNNSGTNNATNPDAGGAGWTQWPFPPPPPASITVIGTTGIVSNVTNLTLNSTTVTGGGGLATATPIPQLSVFGSTGPAQNNIANLEFAGATVTSLGTASALVQFPVAVPLTITDIFGNQALNVNRMNFLTGISIFQPSPGVVQLSPALLNVGWSATSPTVPTTLLHGLGQINFYGAGVTTAAAGTGVVAVNIPGSPATGFPGLGAIGSYLTLGTCFPAGTDGIPSAGTFSFPDPISGASVFSPYPGQIVSGLWEYCGFNDAAGGGPVVSNVGHQWGGTWLCVGPYTNDLPGGNQGFCRAPDGVTILGTGAITLSNPITHWFQNTVATWVRLA